MSVGLDEPNRLDGDRRVLLRWWREEPLPSFCGRAGRDHDGPQDAGVQVAEFFSAIDGATRWLLRDPERIARACRPCSARGIDIESAKAIIAAVFASSAVGSGPSPATIANYTSALADAARRCSPGGSEAVWEAGEAALKLRLVAVLAAVREHRDVMPEA